VATQSTQKQHIRLYISHLQINAPGTSVETACWITLAGIRHQFPGASEETCLDILRQRIEFQKKLEETQCMTISMAQAHSGNKTGSRP